jgi:hypothetical protein
MSVFGEDPRSRCSTSGSRSQDFSRPQAAPMVERHAVLGFAEEQLSMAIASHAADGPVPTIRVSVTNPQIGSNRWT